MTKVGEHITLDIIGTKKGYDPSFFENLIHKISKAAKVTVLEISKYQFKPQGFTILALLAESHMSFHTFPEKGIISFDFFTCGDTPPKPALKILKKDGIIIAMNHNIGSISHRILKERSPIIDIGHAYLYDLDTIRKIIARSKYYNVDPATMIAIALQESKLAGIVSPNIY